jgi:hypothetical protein
VAHFLTITSSFAIATNNHAVNTFHYSADGSTLFGSSDAAKIGQANDAINQLQTFYNALSTAGILGSWRIGDVVVEHETGQPPRYVAATPKQSINTSGSNYAFQVAAVCSWRTAKAGRSYRGRSYIGPLRSTAMSGPDISSTFAAAVATAAAALIAAPGTGQLVPAVYSAKNDTTERITSALCTTACRTMRSRAS